MHKTDWMYERKWGVFVHMLEFYLNGTTALRSMGKETSWDECLNEFDCDAFAKQISELGAGWCFFTIMQQTKYMLAPNEHYNAATGYKNGEACPTFDFIERIYEALAKYDIKLMLYFTADGPSKDERAVKAYPLLPEDNNESPLKRIPAIIAWADVAREYSLRYGTKVAGWWQDGCWIGYNEEEFSYFADAMRAGNPDAVVAQNLHGCLDIYGALTRTIRKGPLNNDYTAGELVDFSDIPYAPFVEEQRWHVLSFLGVPEDKRAYNGWGRPGSKYSPQWMHDYVEQVHDLGGVVTIDICVYRDGHIDEEQVKVLQAINE